MKKYDIFFYEKTVHQFLYEKNESLIFPMEKCHWSPLGMKMGLHFFSEKYVVTDFFQRKKGHQFLWKKGSQYFSMKSGYRFFKEKGSSIFVDEKRVIDFPMEKSIINFLKDGDIFLLFLTKKGSSIVLRDKPDHQHFRWKNGSSKFRFKND